MTPHACPVCRGTGLVSRPPGIPGDQSSWVSGTTGPYPCSPCEGTGLVWAPSEPSAPLPAPMPPAPTPEWRYCEECGIEVIHQGGVCAGCTLHKQVFRS